MRIGRRSRPTAAAAPPPRSRAHPDGAIEIKLQRIRSLQLAIARKEALLAEDQQQVSAMRRVATNHPTWDGHLKRLSQIGDLLAEMRKVEGEVIGLHAEIARAADGLSDVDLAFLQ